MPRDDSVTYKGEKKGWVCGCPAVQDKLCLPLTPYPTPPLIFTDSLTQATDNKNIVSKVFVLYKDISCKGYQKKKIWIERTLTAP